MLQASSTTNGGGTVAHVAAAAPGPAASPAQSLTTPAVHGAEAVGAEVLAGAEVATSVRAPRQRKAPSAKAMRLSRAEGKGEGQARPGVGAGAVSRCARGGARHGNRAGMAAPRAPSAPAGMPVPIESRVAHHDQMYPLLGSQRPPQLAPLRLLSAHLHGSSGQLSHHATMHAPHLAALGCSALPK